MKPIILIVDDKAANRETLCSLLDGQEYQLVEAADGATALRLAAETPPDLVLLDVMMPGMDGYEVCRRLRTDPQLAEVPVIFITALDDQASRITGLEAGADDFVTKPFNRAELRARVRTITRLNRYRRLLNTQSQLREIEERFHKLAEHSDEVFWFQALNPERITYVSPGVENIWKVPVAQFYDDPCLWSKAVHPDDQARVGQANEAMKSGAAVRFEEEYRIVQPDGAIRWVMDSGTPIRNEAGQIVSLGGVARDITERKAAEEQILRAQRLESLGMLAAGIAHDFNNALAPITMGSGLLRLHLTNSGALRTLATMESSAQRGVELVRQLMSFTRGSGGQHQLTQVRHVLREVIGLAQATFPKPITVESHLTGDLWPVQGNTTQIHQIFLNLCVNARDAMPQGGKLTVRAVNCTLDETAAAEIAEARPGAFVSVEVSDTGTGIPPDVQARIWEPFFTTKGEGKGTGLGLSTVRGIVGNHDGFVTLKTQTGQGTAFTVYLPAAKDATLGEPAPAWD